MRLSFCHEISSQSDDANSCSLSKAFLGLFSIGIYSEIALPYYLIPCMDILILECLSIWGRIHQEPLSHF